MEYFSTRRDDERNKTRTEGRRGNEGKIVGIETRRERNGVKRKRF